MYTHSPLSVEIAGLGSYVPERALTNEDLENMVDTSDEWITQRTGVKERRLAGKGQATSDLAIEAKPWQYVAISIRASIMGTGEL